jgi:gentisate 1,2-dioxygenase
MYEEGSTRVIPLDIKEKLKVPYPASTPSLLGNFVRIKSGEKIRTSPNATSEIFYVIRGNGHTDVGDKTIPWNTGDFFVLPAGNAAVHFADMDAAFYWVHDEPLLTYLGVKATERVISQ